MTKERKLLQSLDKVFGFEYIKKSDVKKLKQYFDEKTNEHVFIVEYRVIKGDKEKLEKEQKEERKYRKYKLGELLKSINASVSNSPEVN